MDDPRIREYVVRTPDGVDYGRDPDFDLCAARAEVLGAGAVVVPLDRFLLPLRDAWGRIEVAYTA